MARDNARCQLMMPIHMQQLLPAFQDALEAERTTANGNKRSQMLGAHEHDN